MRLDFCVACGERDRDRLEHHHLLPRAEGGPDTEANLITLCLTCHGIVHGQIRRSSRDLLRLRAVASHTQRAMHGTSGKLALQPRPRRARIDSSNERRRQKAVGYRAFMKLIAYLKAHGRVSLRQQCATLNANGLRTGRGNLWTAATLHHKLKQIGDFFAKHPELETATKRVKRRTLARTRDPISDIGDAHPYIKTPSYPQGGISLPS